ncbi:MAG: efflux RND transporter periplasmic adaptor subunit [Flavobacteriales bacterium]|nr:efflux RND transporter periplasmic adaptor subunit [Flavobacteriales bacterium]
MRLYNNLIKLISAIIFISIMASCNSKKGNTEEEEEEVSSTFVALTNRQMNVINLKLGALDSTYIQSTVFATGILALHPQDKAKVNPMIGGIIKTINVLEGDKVKKGDLLATLEYPDFIQMQEDFIIKSNNIIYLEKEYIRQKKLNDKNVGSKKEFELAIAKYRSTKANIVALEIKLRMLGINVSKIKDGFMFGFVNILSPIDGSVSLVKSNIGSYVEVKNTIFEVVNNANVYADFTIYQKDIESIKIGQQINFTTAGFKNKIFKAEIQSIIPSIETNKKGIHIHANIINGDNTLIFGMYIDGKIITNNIKALVVSEHAVVMNDGLSYVFVKVENEGSEEDENKVMFKKIEVITGIINNGYYQIKLLNKLPADVKIVSYGAYYLLAEMGKGEVEDDD